MYVAVDQLYSPTMVDILMKLNNEKTLRCTCSNTEKITTFYHIYTKLLTAPLEMTFKSVFCAFKRIIIIILKLISFKNLCLLKLH